MSRFEDFLIRSGDWAKLDISPPSDLREAPAAAASVGARRGGALTRYKISARWVEGNRREINAAWRNAQIAAGNNLTYHLPNGHYLTIAITQTAGYFRFDGVDGVSIADIFEAASAVAVLPQANALLFRAASAIEAFADNFDFATFGLGRAVALTGLALLSPTTRSVVDDLLGLRISGPVELVFGQGASLAQADREVLIGFDTATLLGNDTDNVLIKFGAGESSGGGGDDVLLSVRPVASPADAGSDYAGSWEFGDTGFQGGGGSFGGGGATGSWDAPETGATSAPAVVLDGGAGNDWVIAVGGEGAVTVGGLGRDIVINFSRDGEIWGDVRNSVLLGDGTRVYFDNGEQKTITDTADNSDLFEFQANTTILDVANDNGLAREAA